MKLHATKKNERRRYVLENRKNKVTTVIVSLFELKSVSRPIANHLFFLIKIQKRRELQLTRGNVHSHNSRVITAIFGVRPTVTYYNKKKKKKKHTTGRSD